MEMTVENVNVAEVMADEKAREAAEKLEAALEANPEDNALMEAAQSAEDMYQVAKKYISIKLEEFKVLFQKTVDYFKQDKVALQDEVLDSVAGGWSLSNFWNTYKKKIIAVAIVVGTTAAGIAIGAAVGGLGGALLGGAIGFAAGATIVAVMQEADK